MEKNRAKEFIINGDQKASKRAKAQQEVKNRKRDLRLLRGLFSFDVLPHVFSKRWNVDFGVRTGGPGMFAEQKNRADFSVT